MTTFLPQLRANRKKLIEIATDGATSSHKSRGIIFVSGPQIARLLPRIPVARSNVRPTTENSLYEMLQEYMVENESLRNQNQSLMSQHSRDERDQRIISRDNDRLTDKLEVMQRYSECDVIGHFESHFSNCCCCFTRCLGYAHARLSDLQSGLLCPAPTLGIPCLGLAIGGK